ncbi:hypothetical protein CBS101457_006424 [Exobasidium rhododendri]|nr:hypothetical protein CBS101457_006424 [Exobasidium rhododendri]
MQSHQDDRAPLLGHAEEDDVSVSNISVIAPLQAYRKGAMSGVSAIAVQAFSLAFVALIWSLVFTKMPLKPLPLFGYHPIIQSLALLLLIQSIMTLQPTTGSQPSQKQSAFKVHQVVNILLVLPLFTIGVAIMWYLHDQPGSNHFISWHGKLGFGLLIWAWLQVAIGIAVSSFHGKLVGGVRRAKGLYKWHRLSGYILLPLFLFTAFLGATQTSWSQQNATSKHHLAVGVCLAGAAVGIGYRLQPEKLPH